MKAVLDTNVIVSALLTGDGVCDRIVDLYLAGRFHLCMSDAILAEYAEVLARPKFNIAPERSAALLSYMRGKAKYATARMKGMALPDPDDHIFLATALNSHADYLVTSNTRDFPAKLCRGVCVITPAAFLRLLKT